MNPTKQHIEEIIRGPSVERWRAIGRDLDARADHSRGYTAHAQRLGARVARRYAVALIFDALGMHE